MRSLTERVPLFIAEGDKRFAGIGIEAGGKKELVVLDFSSDIAKEVRRISSGDLILVDDLNDDGKTDGVFFNQKEFITFELASGKEINRNPLPHVENFQVVSVVPQGDFIRVETKAGIDRRLKLIDPVTLEVEWDMNWPRDTNFGGLLCGSAAAKVSGKALAAGTSPQKLANGKSPPRQPAASALPLTPRVLFTESLGTAAVIAVAKAAQFQGSAESFAKRFRSPDIKHDFGVASFTTASADPRLIEPLPWNYYGNPMGMFEIDGLDRSPVVLITQLLPIVFGVIVFPVGYLYTMVKMRRWSLQWFLLLPLVFVLPYILLQIPSALGPEYSTSSVPAWRGKLWAAVTLLPFLIFIGVFAKYAFLGILETTSSIGGAFPSDSSRDGDLRSHVDAASRRGKL